MTDQTKPDLGYSYGGLPQLHTFVQYKGTDICMDFHCECGAHCHFDGYFAYSVKCPHCGTVYQMPFNLFPRKVTPEIYSSEHHWSFDDPKLLEPDEDMEVST